MQISLKNFRSVGELELDFPEGQTTLVSGPNGSGKSSICLAFAWAILDELPVAEATSAAVSDIVKAGTKCAEVILELGSLSILQRRNGDGPYTEAWQGKEHPLLGTRKDIREQLATLLGVSGLKPSEAVREYLRTVCVTPSSQSIFSLSSTERTAYLLEIFQIGVFERLRAQLVSRRNRSAVELETVSSFKIADIEWVDTGGLEARLGTLSDTLQRAPHYSEIPSLKSSVALHMSHIASLQADTSRLNELGVEIAKLTPVAGGIDIEVYEKLLQDKPPPEEIPLLEAELFFANKEPVELTAEYETAVLPTMSALSDLRAKWPGIDELDKERLLVSLENVPHYNQIASLSVTLASLTAKRAQIIHTAENTSGARRARMVELRPALERAVPPVSVLLSESAKLESELGVSERELRTAQRTKEATGVTCPLCGGRLLWQADALIPFDEEKIASLIAGLSLEIAKLNEKRLDTSRLIRLRQDLDELAQLQAFEKEAQAQLERELSGIDEQQKTTEALVAVAEAKRESYERLEARQELEQLTATVASKKAALEARLSDIAERVGRQTMRLDKARAHAQDFVQLSAARNLKRTVDERASLEKSQKAAMTQMSEQLAMTNQRLEEALTAETMWKELEVVKLELSAKQASNKIAEGMREHKQKVEVLKKELTLLDFAAKFAVPFIIRSELDKRSGLLESEINRALEALGAEGPVTVQLVSDSEGVPKSLEIRQLNNNRLADFRTGINYSEQNVLRLAAAIAQKRVHPGRFKLDFLLLDDPYLAMDESREEQISRGLKEMMTGTTVVFTCHADAERLLEPAKVYRIKKVNGTTVLA